MDRQKRLERLQLISSLFDAAIEKPPKKWDAYLAYACPDDAEVRRQVKDLLESFQGPVNPLKPAGTDLFPDASPQAEPFTMVGRQVGPYWLKRMLNRDATGVQYEALQTKTNQDVRVLVIPPKLAAQRETMAQLRQDTARLNALNEPCFPQVVELKKTRAHTLLVTLPVAGETLAERLAADGPMDWEEALPLFQTLVKVVRKAHQGGVVHRALTADKIYLDQDTKSGLLIDGFGPYVPPEADTATNIQPGTGYDLRYLGPEHFAETPTVDEGSDQYSLGVIFYELLAGAVPLDPDCTGATAHQFITTHQLTEADTFDLDVPEELADLIRRTLAGDPTKRFRNLGRVLKALKAFSQAASPPELAAPWVEVPSGEADTEPVEPEADPAPEPPALAAPSEAAFESGDSLPRPREVTSEVPDDPPVPVLAEEVEASAQPEDPGPKAARRKQPKAAAPSRIAAPEREPAVSAVADAESHPAVDRTRRRWAIMALLFALAVVLFAIGLQLSNGQRPGPLSSRAAPFHVAAPAPPATAPTSSAPLQMIEQTNPEPIGGYGVIQREIQYPDAVPDRSISGTVIIELTVEVDGAVHNPKVVQGLAKPFDQEALRVVQHTRFRPARQGETAVPATIRLPIWFSP